MTYYCPAEQGTKDTHVTPLADRLVRPLRHAGMAGRGPRPVLLLALALRLQG